MQLKNWLVMILLVCIVPGIEAAAEKEPGERSPAKVDSGIKQLEASLEYEQGLVTIGKNLATLKVPEDFHFLGSRDARKVIEDLWGNPANPSILGLLLPADKKPSEKECWAIIITYEEEGFVKDDDAASLDFADMLSTMKKSISEENPERTKAGFSPVELIGWAAPPHYDSVEKKLYWAKELKFGDDDDHTLNYNIRILGRRGVLVLNAVAEMDQFDAIDKITPKVLGFVDFKQGNRYQDFDPGIDKVAAYGVGALIAGSVALKVGLFKGLWIAIIAAKKFVILGVLALAAFLSKIFRGKKKSAGE